MPITNVFFYNYDPMKAKVSIIGAGRVGMTTAQLILQSGLPDIVLYDIMEGGLFVGVPVILARKGVEKIMELSLTDEEKKESINRQDRQRVYRRDHWLKKQGRKDHYVERGL